MIKPMLLSDAGPVAFTDPEWLWEVKWDGIRCLAVKAGARVRLWSRHQREMTRQFPEVVAGLEAALRADGIFDGELTCLAGDGRSDFYEVMGRHVLRDDTRIARAAITTPATFMAFDVIEMAGERTTSMPLAHRKVALADLVRPVSAVQLVESFPGSAGLALLQAVAARDVEGIVGKRLASTYRLDHRSTDWVKVKAWRERTLSILGIRFEPEFGVLVGEPGAAPLCVVELGWTPTDRAALVRMLPELAPRRLGGVTWISPVLRARIRYRVTPAGRIREPVWSGFALAA